MQKAFAQKHLYEATNQFFRSRGFKFDQGMGAYTRQFPEGEQRYYLSLVSSGNSYLVEPSIAVRFAKIEEIFHRTSDIPDSHQVDSATLWLEMEWLSGLPRSECVPRVAKMEDIHEAASVLEGLFTRYGEPYLEKHKTLEDVDRVLNETPGVRTIHSSLPRSAGYGLIVAALLNRDDFEELVRKHRAGVAKLSRGFYLEWFDRLVEDLREHY